MDSFKKKLKQTVDSLRGKNEDPHKNEEAEKIEADSKQSTIIQADKELKENNEFSDNKKIDPTSKNCINIHVIQARNLPGADSTGLSDPYVILKLRKNDEEFSLKRKNEKGLLKTRTIKRTKHPIWNENLVVEKIGLREEISEVIFEVYDEDRFSKDDLLGYYQYSIKNAWDFPQPPQWVHLKDETGKQIDGEIQIQLSCLSVVDRVSLRHFTHVLALTIAEAKNLSDMEWVGRSGPVVEIGWGAQLYKTRQAQNPINPVWNETCFMFVDNTKESNYFLKITVFDAELGENENLGTTLVKAEKLFNADNLIFEDELGLLKLKIHTDAEIPKDIEIKDSSCGSLKIRAKLIPKEKVQQDFFNFLIKQFDSDNDGSLNKEEVSAMFALLHIEDNVDTFLDKYDQNGDGKLENKEVGIMLNSSDFQESNWMPSLMVEYLKTHGESDIINTHLMTGFTKDYPTTGRTVIFVCDRYTGLMVQENVPHYIFYSMRLMYNTKTGRVLSRTAKHLLYKMSKEQGRKYDLPESKKEIDHFIELHHLDMDTVSIPKENFQTFNDFFARPIKNEARPIVHENETCVLSPADCRMMVFNSIYESNVWVKGAHFTVENLLDISKEIAPNYIGGSFCIARLAPQDYHRWHWPVSGRIKNITPIDGALYTVNPIAINQTIDIYTQNKRCIIEIDTGEIYGIVLLIAVGATMVGSYRLFEYDNKILEINSYIKRGDVAGEFRFGGSTILLLFEPKKIVFDDDLIQRSKNKIETLIRVRDRIATKIQ